jgi:plasmid stabilization system protein ParE
MKVVWSARAVAQLDDVVAYIAQDSPHAAGNVARHIRRTADLLGHVPKMGRLTNEGDARVVVVPRYPYLVFYRVLEDRDLVRIVRVRHAARQRHRP